MSLKFPLSITLACCLLLVACGGGTPEIAQEPTATLQPIVSQTPRFTATPEPTWTPLPSFTFTPTQTAIPPTPTLSPTPTLTPTIVGAISSTQLVNVREGPGITFSAFIALPAGTQVQILGQDPSGQWLNVRLEDGDEGWVSARLVRVPDTPTPVPSPTPSPDLTALFLGTPLPTAILGGGTVTPTPPESVRTPGAEGAEAEATAEVNPPTATSEVAFIPTVNLSIINQTATALAGGAATVTPSITPTASPTAPATATPIRELTPAEQRDIGTPEPQLTRAATATPDAANVVAGEGIDVFAYCDNPAFGLPGPDSLAAGSTVDFYWAWFARERNQVQQHLDAATYEVRINGQPVTNLDNYRTRVRPVDGRDEYVTYWWVPFGPLEPGDYQITVRLTWERQITDGYNFYGPGTAIPVEEESCSFTVR